MTIAYGRFSTLGLPELIQVLNSDMKSKQRNSKFREVRLKIVIVGLSALISFPFPKQLQVCVDSVIFPLQ